MVISAYQINNVLRVYGEQLRRGRISNRQRSTDTNSPDKITISASARRETIIDDITSNIVERITHFEPHENVESEYGKPLPNNEGRQKEFIFKEIDENGETINSFSLEDSKFLTNKLKEITKETVEKNMR
jgi:hypothetical protein